MKRHKALRSLSQEHHRGLMLIQLNKTGSPEYKGLPTTFLDKKLFTIIFFEDNLTLQFKKEEMVYFPSAKIKSSDLENLVSESSKQHKEINSLVGNLKKSPHPEKELDKLGKLLENHIRKEERGLFQMVQEVLSKEELLKLDSDLGEASPSCRI